MEFIDKTRRNAIRLHFEVIRLPEISLQQKPGCAAKKHTEKYKSELTNKEIAYIEKICRLEMRWFGYEVHTPEEDLQAIPQDEVSAYHEIEINTLTYERRESLSDIMQAMSVFYNRESPANPA